ncbi:MAG: sensor histidine kinase [Halobacteriales archaeon]|nr:sensor histidine kinase [Halobacteriales archaeon]
MDETNFVVKSTGRRLAAAGSIAVLGGLLLVTTVMSLTGAETSRGTATGLIGALLGLIIIIAGVLLYRSSMETRHVGRVAGWSVLGVVVLGGTLLLAAPYLASVPLFVIATILAVSIFAHLIIGIHDVWRIRSQRLAREREKLTVINTLLRHNLRHEAQRLLGYASEIEDEHTRDEVHAVGTRLSALNEKSKYIETTLEETSTIDATVQLAAVVGRAAEALETEYTELTVRQSVSDDLVVRGDDRLERVVRELIENAAVHGDDGPVSVTVSAETRGETIELSVIDDGEGLPELERSVIERETPLTQLTHSMGVGLWLSKWLTESVGGTLHFESHDGNAVVLTLIAP